MNELKLSKRLETVAEAIPFGSTLADIGSDHAYLPIYCKLNGIVRFAIAGEVVEGPFQTAKNQVERLNLQNSVEVRRGDGLEVIQPGEVEVVTICGMGGALITSILESGKHKLDGVKRIILQPNIMAINIRKWLIENNWALLQEFILEEDGKIYEVLVAEKGNSIHSYTSGNLETELLLGPFLMQDKSEVFIKKWTSEKKNWERVLSELQGAKSSEEVQAKQEEIKNLIRIVEEAIF
ncbi:tRNA (adenine(22)-N(1))-methyltransferase [Bacillus suaedaesalsae]|uniref:tRNA (Adenine-N(1))-methyltransferase n=1 Tax=Bacillus suaedaesalsae TaxID=2810349 RepID=A0ABS2DLB9_9BACI|nr:tRNA (adenine(22)-N(1))-methyltransferase TrmK [Bacillus suaedaesalsae]MBM6619274.1 tRNA (adenine-N(1))-methyltransferase [Bacillus suaedaesalsae]